MVPGLLNSCHLEHVFGERSFTPNIAERFTFGELASSVLNHLKTSSFRNDKYVRFFSKTNSFLV